MTATRDLGPSGRRIIELPPPTRAEGVSLWQALCTRRSRREFGRLELRDDEVAALLFAGQGLTSPEGARAVPSAGALYPVSLTLVDGRGVWRYRPRRHDLVEVSSEDRRALLAAAAFGQHFVAEAPAIIVITAEPAVLEARYGGRSMRYCTLEAGHVAQNMLLQATALGLASVPVSAFDDDEVLATVDLGRDHLALYVLTFGRPRP